MSKRATHPAKETSKGAVRGDRLCPALPPDWLAAPCYLFGSDGLIIGAVLYNLTVGQLRVPLLLQRSR